MTKRLNPAVGKHPDKILAQAAVSPLSGEFVPPGDKSISHRALILGTLAKGRSRIEGLLGSEDVGATAAACRQLGAEIELSGQVCQVEGIGKTGLTPPDDVLDMGNSGTAMRLLAGVLAAQPFDSTLTGDESLCSRPMNRIVRPLREMGAVIEAQKNGCAPLCIEGGHQLRGIHYQSPVASAQIKSCVLLAGLFATGETAVTEPATSRDHTERMLRTFGANISDSAVIRGGNSLHAADFSVPADISSAAFALAAAALVPASSIQVRNVGLNPTRSGLIDAMRAMGCDLQIENERWFGAEPVGDIGIHWRDGISAVELGASEIPAIIDELPVLMAMAARADGVTRIRGAGELRVKESDRIAVMAKGLKTLGFRVQEYPDGIDIVGKPLGAVDEIQHAARAQGEFLHVQAAGDHRCAMSFCVLAQTLSRPVVIGGSANIDTSYPRFIRDISALGGSVRHQEVGLDD